MAYLRDDLVDIAFLQETWLNKGDNNIYAEMEEYGFKIIKSMRNKNRGGGLAVLYKPSLQVKKVNVSPKTTFKTFEYIACTMPHNNRKIQLVNFYRLPYSTVHPFTQKMFLEEFNVFLSLLDNDKPMFLIGDFNINLLDYRNIYSIDFLKLLDVFNLRQLVKYPTHFKGGLLDLVIGDKNFNLDENMVKVDTLFRTDHYPIQFYLNQETPSPAKSVVEVRNYNSIDIKQFSTDINNSEIGSMPFFSQLSSNDSVELYNSTLVTLTDKHCPMVKKIYKENHSNSKWFNKSLQQLKQEKRKTERHYKKHSNDENWVKFTTARNKYNLELKQTRTNFFKSSLANCKKDPKTLFKTLNKLTGNVKQQVLPSHESEDIVAEKMSTFYLDKIDNIRQEVGQTISVVKPITVTKKSNQQVNFKEFKKLTLADLKLIFSSMNNKTCKLDPAPTFLIKKCFIQLSPLILHIINKSFEENIFPDSLKHALVTPIIKDANGSVDDFKNYRPVSNLPFISKVQERAAYIQLNEHIENNKLHSQFQSSYRKNHSCETAMFKVIGDIQKSVSENNNVALVLLDSSAAFDTVDHNILLKRLENNFGIKDKALEWIRSYLTNRTFSVVVNKAKSQPNM